MTANNDRLLVSFKSRKLQHRDADRILLPFLLLSIASLCLHLHSHILLNRKDWMNYWVHHGLKIFKNNSNNCSTSSSSSSCGHYHYHQKFFPFSLCLLKEKNTHRDKDLINFWFLRDPIRTVTLKTDCMYVLRSLQTNYMPFVTMFLSWSTMRWILASKNEVAAKSFRVYADVVGKLPSVPLDLS